MEEKDFRESIRFFWGTCCLEHHRAVITDDGEWKLRCEKCGKVCVTSKEKYEIKKELLVY